MAGTGRKWLVGCGIGCGLFIVILGGIGTCGYFGIKKISDRADEMDAGYEVLTEVYGRPDEFTPDADGTIPADRLETFLAVRGDLAATGEDLGSTLALLDDDGSANVIAKIRAGITFVPRIFDFIEDRNRVLADRGMGLGEYMHIYSVAYYSWLDMDPADGPDFQISGDNEDSGVRWGVQTGDGDVRERRAEDLRGYLNRMQRAILDNQIAAAERAALDDAWLTILRDEAVAMDGRSHRLLWESALPARIRDSLEPFRGRLEGSYSPMMNAVEMGLVEHE